MTTATPTLEYKVAAVGTDELTLIDAGNGEIEGRASSFNGLDSYNDTVRRGAFADTIPTFLERGFLAWQHEWTEPIGIITAAEERADGFHIRAQFHSDRVSQERRQMVRERLALQKFVGLSIGYVVERSHREGDVRVIDRARLIEVSVVSLPADSGAYVTSAKSEPVTAATLALRAVYAKHVLEPRLRELERQHAVLEDVERIFKVNELARAQARR